MVAREDFENRADAVVPATVGRSINVAGCIGDEAGVGFRSIQSPKFRQGDELVSAGGNLKDRPISVGSTASRGSIEVTGSVGYQIAQVGIAPIRSGKCGERRDRTAAPCSDFKDGSLVA